ncbi:sensor histidine kinase [Saccharicrinis sp. FJH62]|uniref:sensor histidine kinase n=1 Tax=Saccharicrinis sp. FJH62 TaxID=3344657 RepID=UPI0035D4D229
MKRQNILLSILLFKLIFFSAKLLAENPEGRFHINEGDWFEMQVDLPLNYSDKSGSPLNFFKEAGKTELSVLLHYQLQKQRSNGNQIYNVSIQRIQSKVYASSFNTWLGYDSYYPPYRDNVKSVKPFIQSELEVTPDGNIIRFDSISGYAPTFKLTEISPKVKNKIGISFNFKLPTQLIELVSGFTTFLPPKSGPKSMTILNSEQKIETNDFRETEFYSIYKVTSNDTVTTEVKYLKKEGILISDQIGRLVNASFPIPANSIIKGKLADLANRKITISLEGDRDEAYFKKRHFDTGEDGSFSCPVFLNEPLYLKIDIGSKTISSFFVPGDTLEILDIPSKVERVSIRGTLYDQPTEPGHLFDAINFRGKAAYNAKLSVEMDEWMTYMPLPKNVRAYSTYHETIIKNIRYLLNLYSKRATKECVDYFRSKWNYYLAADKLYFREENETILYEDMFSSHKASEKEVFDFPAGFFLEVDTLPTLMYPYKWCKYYQSFLHYAFDFKKQRLEMSVGGQNNDFYGNYYFARASLKGYPLYTALYKAFDKELRGGFAAASGIEPFYQDFINNCKDPSLTEPLEQVHKTVSELAPGKAFPVQSFILKDSTVFNLAQYKGKPVCLVIMRSEKRMISYYKKEMDKFMPDEVEFIFVSLPNTYSDKSPAADSIMTMPNVKVIDVMEQDLGSKLLKTNQDKIFVLDKWLRIVDDNVKSPLNYIGNKALEEAIRKAIDAKRYTKAEKASFYKTAGWSLGSILFTLFIGFLVYRMRIRKIRRQEALKRQIKELEIKAIRSQMNPHFVFNALNSIQSLVNSSQYKETNIYLAKFSVLMRSVLNNSERSMVSLSEELEAVKLYCELEQLRFEFELSIEVSSDINSDLIEIPGMIIQPLAENAVVHGLSSLGGEGKLSIKVDRCKDKICVYVTDNGTGLSQQKEDKLSQKGFGLKLVQERLAILNHKNKQARLTVENNREKAGTTATLIIPVD